MSDLAIEAPPSEGTRTPRGALRQRVRSRSGVSAVLVALVVLGLAALAWRQRWMADDAFINLRVIDQLLAGHGPVFNAGERVEIYTSPLWLGLVAVGSLFGTLSMEWVAVMLGLIGTLVGVAAGCRASWLLWRGVGLTGIGLPLGALAIAALRPFWDFATSGLETGLSFAWLGLVYLGVVESQRRSGRTRLPTLVAVAIGLGPLVRPDLALFSVCFFAALLIARPSISRGATARLVGAAVALPLAYQIFRMGYFASLVPNTALAKEASHANWSRGFDYLRDFVDPYVVWFPVAVLLGYGGYQLRTRPSSARHGTLAIACAPVVGALLHFAYVVRVGGDYMHGRLLLPSLFGLMLPVMVVVPPRRLAVLLTILVLPWAVVAGAALRADYANRPFGSNGLVSDEHAFHVEIAKQAHPVTLADFSEAGSVVQGRQLRRLAAGRGDLRLYQEAAFPNGNPTARVRPSLHTNTVAAFSFVGLAGFAAGPDVDIVDVLGLGDPIAGRLELAPITYLDGRTVPAGHRAGHEKLLPPEWVFARFAANGTVRPSAAAGGRSFLRRVDAAREALRCGDLKRVTDAVDQPLGAGRFIRNIGVAVGTYGFRIPSDARAAARELC